MLKCPTFLLSAALTIVSITFSQRVSALEFGFCITPFGTYGVVPCDLACIGSAAVEGAINATSKYAEYVGTLAQATGTTAVCSASTISGAAKISSKISTGSTRLQIQINKETLQLTDLIAGSAHTHEENMRISNKIKQELALRLQNHITQTAKVMIGITNEQNKQSSTQSKSTTQALLENIEDIRLLLKDRKIRKVEMLSYSSVQKNADTLKQKSSVLENASKDLLKINEAASSWNNAQSLFDISPNHLYKIVNNLPKSIDLLASELALQNTTNLHKFLAINDGKAYEIN